MLEDCQKVTKLNKGFEGKKYVKLKVWQSKGDMSVISTIHSAEMRVTTLIGKLKRT